MEHYVYIAVLLIKGINNTNSHNNIAHYIVLVYQYTSYHNYSSWLAG